MPIDPGRKSPAASSCHTLLKLSTRLSGSSPTSGMTAQFDWRERGRERKREGRREGGREGRREGEVLI